MMRGLIALVLVAFAGWAAWWWIGSGREEDGIRGWLAADHDAGWVATNAGVQTRGFPNRFDTTITEPAVTLPDRGLVWSAPFAQILRLSYGANHLIVALPHEQILQGRGWRVLLRSDSARGSLVFGPGAERALERAVFDIANLRIEAEGEAAGKAVGKAEALQLASRPSPRGGGAVNIGIRGRGLDLPGIGRIDQLWLDADVTLDAPLDRHAAEDRLPRITRIDIREMEAQVGGRKATATGTVTVDRAGLVSGEVTVTGGDALLSLAGADRAAGPLVLRVEKGRVLLGETEIGNLPALLP